MDTQRDGSEDAAPETEPDTQRNVATLQRIPQVQTRWRSTFLQALKRTANITRSATEAGMTRAAIYDAMERDAWFKEQVEEALHGLNDTMEGSVYERGVGWTEPVLDKEGRKIGERKAYDTPSALAWLKAKRPGEWDRARQVEHTVNLNEHRVLELRQSFSVDELRAIVQGMRSADTASLPPDTDAER